MPVSQEASKKLGFQQIEVKVTPALSLSTEVQFSLLTVLMAPTAETVTTVVSADTQRRVTLYL